MDQGRTSLYHVGVVLPILILVEEDQNDPTSECVEYVFCKLKRLVGECECQE